MLSIETCIKKPGLRGRFREQRFRVNYIDVDDDAKRITSGCNLVGWFFLRTSQYMLLPLFARTKMRMPHLRVGVFVLKPTLRTSASHYTVNCPELW